MHLHSPLGWLLTVMIHYLKLILSDIGSGNCYSGNDIYCVCWPVSVPLLFYEYDLISWNVYSWRWFVWCLREVFCTLHCLWWLTHSCDVPCLLKYKFYLSPFSDEGHSVRSSIWEESDIICRAWCDILSVPIILWLCKWAGNALWKSC